MGKKAKSKTGQATNDSRSNRKASKQNPGRKSTGSKGVKLDEKTKILMGKGLYAKFDTANTVGARALAGKKPKK